ncbi:MAG: hypothetical protein HN742_27430 [Lentisphaerae bacterium]|jgi:hypothetical protein|nr:hypothetical protein [Lentisphaerota bacterium]MBT5607963.1 hypothetical protein [Lentisphaerota bacterium]MBT7057490.1 hypothetical protein [Lentisphaerota bacterium]MBT7845636.1 hypothetical protein [Lentisphaerota bacterium]
MIRWRGRRFVGILREVTGLPPGGTNLHSLCLSERMNDETPQPSSPPCACRQQWVSIVLLVLAAMATLVFLFTANRPGGQGALGAGGKPAVLRDLVGVRVGSEKAPIQVDAMLPVSTGCQDAVGLFLIEAARMHGKKLSVRVFDMKSVDAQMIMTRTGIKCAAVIVDGDTRFDLGGAIGKVLLEGPMELSDVRAVVSGKLAAVSGGTPPELPAIAAPDEGSATKPEAPPSRPAP